MAKAGFEVVIFTCSKKAYADRTLDQLGCKAKSISRRLYRENCDYKASDNIYLKDLRLLNGTLSKTILVDNNTHSFELQPENGF
jgi:TFIIF-interacting CTD phosphatase-like protein